MPELNENELQAIKALEYEMIQDQLLEIRIKSIDGRNPIQGIVNKYAATASLYSNPFKLQAMIDEIELSLNRLIKTTNYTGRILGKKAIQTYLEKSERIDRTQRQLRIISNANASQAARRLDLAMLELKKEVGIFKADIDIFAANAKIAGFSKKETLAQLVRAGADKDGIAQGFAKRVKSVAVAARRREKSAAEIGELSKQAKPNEMWVWITISKGPCPDCQIRAGKILPFDRWVKMGLPGSGKTICGKYCRCKLKPASIADKQHPTVREFNLDTDKLVLTTASEERVLRAKKNQYDLLKEKKNASKKNS